MERELLARDHMSAYFAFDWCLCVNSGKRSVHKTNLKIIFFGRRASLGISFLV